MRLLAGAWIVGLGAGFLPAQLAPVVDPEIRRAVERVSAAELEKTVRKLVSFGTRHTQSVTSRETRGIGAARRWIKRRLEEISRETGRRLLVHFEKHAYPSSRRLAGGAEVVNVVGTLPGVDRDRYVIVSGHYDSRASRGSDAESDAPGADDDASGTACVIEAARVLGHLRPRATLLFLLTAGEEQGLLGARGHVKIVKQEDRRIEAFVTNDIIGGVVGSNGRREVNRVRLFSEGMPSGPRFSRSGRVRRRIAGSTNDAPSRQLARYLEARGERYVPGFDVTLIFRQDRYGRGGDHIAFNQEGYRGVRFSEVHENYDYQHQNVREENGRLYGDRLEHLDYDYVKRVTQVNVAGLAEIALAPASPSNVRIVTRPGPDTILSWDPNREKDLAGYGILHRRTHEPTWTHRTTVPPDQTRTVLKGLSKDDWYFAVQAFDRAGHRSIPVYPRPGGRRR